MFRHHLQVPSLAQWLPVRLGDRPIALACSPATDRWKPPNRLLDLLRGILTIAPEFGSIVVVAQLEHPPNGELAPLPIVDGQPILRLGDLAVGTTILELAVVSRSFSSLLRPIHQRTQAARKAAQRVVQWRRLGLVELEQWAPEDMPSCIATMGTWSGMPLPC
jgi:hypothetical protein